LHVSVERSKLTNNDGWKPSAFFLKTSKRPNYKKKHVSESCSC
jgi:hypothetical protein